PHVRIDTGFRAGDAVTPYYDALLAKLIVRGADRAQALERMIAALHRFRIAGVTSNVGFLTALLSDPQVKRGAFDTGFIEREIVRFTSGARALTALDVAAACAAVLWHEHAEQTAASEPSPWERPDGWMLAGRRRRRLSFRYGAASVIAVLGYAPTGLTLEWSGQARPLQFAARGAQ